MNKKATLQRCRAVLDQVDDHVERMLDQRERFEQMASSLQTWAAKWSTVTLERWLHIESLPLIEHEKALVALALKGTDDAGAVIRAYNPSSDGEPHKLFYQVARIEWEQRHQARWGAAA